MPRYIDVDEFVKRVIQYPKQSTKTIGLALKDTPTADVVEVVRCKDCKWWDITDRASTLTPNVCRCKRVSRLWMESDAFCAYGERRER